MVNDQMSMVCARPLRPRLLLIEPRLVPSTQAVASAKRGSILTAHCSWALFAAAGDAKVSASALFTDIRSAYYSIIRQYVTGFCGLDASLLAIIARLSLSVKIAVAALAFIHACSSILEVGGVDPSVLALLRDLNESTWFVVDSGAHAQGIPPRT